MLKIKNCPLVAITKKGDVVLFERDVTVKTGVSLELTAESIVEISIELFKKGIDIISITIDESRMNYIGIEVL